MERRKRSGIRQWRKKIVDDFLRLSSRLKIFARQTFSFLSLNASKGFLWKYQFYFINPSLEVFLSTNPTIFIYVWYSWWNINSSSCKNRCTKKSFYTLIWSRFKLVKQIHRAKGRKVAFELLDKARNFFSIFFYRNIATIFLREREREMKFISF